MSKLLQPRPWFGLSLFNIVPLILELTLGPPFFLVSPFLLSFCFWSGSAPVWSGLVLVLVLMVQFSQSLLSLEFVISGLQLGTISKWLQLEG
jgi:hypothetical protein